MKKILLVEDDPFLIDIYSNQLKGEGFSVEIAKDGLAALGKVKELYPDLVILDIMLPKMNGWDVLREIRKDDKIKNVKVIVLSNLNKDEYTEDIFNLGVIKYFLKIESTPDDILNSVREILKTT